MNIFYDRSQGAVKREIRRNFGDISSKRQGNIVGET